MILNGRPLSDLSLDDFRILIEEKISEGPTIDYKQTAYSGRPQDRREMLRDIIAFANASGGYLILGIEEDGLGRAVRFAPIEEPHTIAKSIKQTCLDGISERVDGLEVKVYETGFNQGLIVIRIPPSEQIPHMIVLDNRTEFVRRYGDDKRSMTIAEIRRAIISVPAYRQFLEMELAEKARYLANSSGDENNGLPYVQAITERPVERFIYRYMIGIASTQTLVVVSPYVSDLEGGAYDLRTIINKVNKSGTRLIVCSAPRILDTREKQVTLFKRRSE